MKTATRISPTIADVGVRRMNEDEAAELLSSLGSGRREPAILPESSGREVSREWIGWSAARGGLSLGTMLCALVRRKESTPVARIRSLANFLPRFARKRGDQTPRIELVELTTTSGQLGEEAERALLLKFLEELRRSWSHHPVVVPESELNAQLLLRDAGYKAVRVLRGYYEREDGYLMLQ